MAPRVCIICGALGTTRWTLTNGGGASVADLCGQHSLPLQEVVDVAGLKPPASIGTITNEPPPVIQRQPRKTSFEPLDWQPPS